LVLEFSMAQTGSVFAGDAYLHQSRYPARYVDVFWNVAHDKVREVDVVFIPRRSAGGPKPGAEFWAEFGAYIGRWDFDLGATQAADG
jgi:hypothetical protein